MGEIIAVVNQKGGVGKTTSVVNLSAYLAMAGKRVLVVDTDPQGNATSGLCGPDGPAARAGSEDYATVYELLVNEQPVAECTIPTMVDGLTLVPATLDLAGAEQELSSRIGRETLLRHQLEAVRADYDYILLDAPPSLGLLTLNCLAAADGVLLPVQCEYYALEGVGQVVQTIDLVRKHLNPRLQISYVALTMFDSRARSSKQVVEQVRSAFGPKVFETVIPRNVRLSEAPSHGLPVALYDKSSRGAKAYQAMAKEVLDHAKTGNR
ncbi:MAG: ParA family protein [Chthonomonadales bacterium]